MIPTSTLASFQHLDWSAIPIEQIGDGIQRQMIYGDRLMVCRLQFAPHVVTPVHSHVHEQITIVERGKVDFVVDRARRPAAAGDVLLFPSNIRHGATILDQETVLIDIFSPPREDFFPRQNRTAVATMPSSAATDVFRLDGKVALVTGASRGLGAAIAVALSSAGANVALHSNEHPAEATAQRIATASGRRTELMTADLADRTAADRLVEGTLSAFDRIDILVNNAGIIRRHAALQHTDDEWDAVLEVNLSNAFRLSRAVGRHLIERQRPGKIINVASLLSFQGGINVPGYSAAKGGLVQLTKALANEWASQGINVNAIAPGYMQTDNTLALREDPQRNRQITERIPAGRWGSPEDVGGAAVFLASKASDYVHGHVLVVDGGWMGR